MGIRKGICFFCMLFLLISCLFVRCFSEEMNSPLNSGMSEGDGFFQSSFFEDEEIETSETARELDAQPEGKNNNNTGTGEDAQNVEASPSPAPSMTTSPRTGSPNYGSANPGSAYSGSGSSGSARRRVASNVANVSENKSKAIAYSIKPRISLNVEETLFLVPKKSCSVFAYGMISGDKVAAWVSSNPKVVSVTNGKLKAGKSGKAIITVTSAKGAKASISVIVSNPCVRTNRSRVSLNTKQKFTLRFSGLSNGDQIASCKSSNSKVASVNKNGLIRAKKKGSTRITIKTKYGAKTTVKVTVT